MPRPRPRRPSIAVLSLAAALAASGCSDGDEPGPAPTPECVFASDCAAPASPCLVVSCLERSCVVSPRPAGTSAGGGALGDCRADVCNGMDGVATSAIDDGDVPADGNACTLDVCTAGVPSNPPADASAACAQDGGSRCDGGGACVQCLAAADCPGSDTECSTRTCTGGVCGATLAPLGTPLAAQVAGDCRQAVCDGLGGTTTAALDADVPADDGSPCTAEACMGGVPLRSPASEGSACTGPNGATMCDASGACVQCVTAATCPGTDGECQHRTCTAGVCGVAFPLGNAVAAQTVGDCSVSVCDGSGGVVSTASETDVPVDGNVCTEDLCLSGAPSNPPVAAGAACAASGGKVCDGAGACVACNAGPDCASGVCADHACQAPACTDQVKNGEETDMDCGGPACGGCAVSRACLVPGDCTTGICRASRCAAPSCSDGVKNGDETDLDCGGACPGCSPTQACLVPGDCATRNCAGGTCGAPLVTGSFPGDGATDVAPATAVTLLLGRPVNSASATAQATSGPCSGTVQLSADGFATCLGMAGRNVQSSGDTATFQPTPPLAPATTYRVRTTGSLLSFAAGAYAPFSTPLGFTTAGGGACAGALVISQVYAHGGLPGASFANDYVELHNNGPTPVRLDGLSVQVPPGLGWSVTQLTGTIPAGGYHLVKLGSSGSAGAPLPAPDAVGTANLSPAGGWVILSSTLATPVSGTCPTVGRLDVVGWGVLSSGSPVSCSEVAPAAAPQDGGAALVRAGAGCADANGNAEELASQLAVPRSSATAPFVCGCAGAAMNGTGLTVEMDRCTVHFPASLAATAGATTGPVYGRVFELGITEPAAPPAPPLLAELGYGPAGTDPRYASGWTFLPATFAAQVGNDDEFEASFTAPAAGSWVYTYRFSPDGLRWTYCDPNGAGSIAGSAFEPNSLPALTVTP